MQPPSETDKTTSSDHSFRTYRLALRWIVLSALPCIPAGIMLATFGLAVLGVSRALAAPTNHQPTAAFVFSCMLAAISPLATVSVLSAISFVGNAVFTRLKVTPSGLDYKYWP